MYVLRMYELSCCCEPDVFAADVLGYAMRGDGAVERCFTLCVGTPTALMRMLHNMLSRFGRTVSWRKIALALL